MYPIYEIRRQLKRRSGSFVVVTGIVDKKSLKKVDSGNLRRTILIKDIRNREGLILANHLWQEVMPHFKEFKPGDKVRITGYVAPYKKSTGVEDFNIEVDSVDLL